MNQVTVTSIKPDEARPGERIRVRGSGFRRKDRVEIWDDERNAPEKLLSKSATRWVSAEELSLLLPKRIGSGRKRLVWVGSEGARQATEGVFTILPFISGVTVGEEGVLTVTGAGLTPQEVRIGGVMLGAEKIAPSRLAITLSERAAVPEGMPTASADLAAGGFQVRRDGFSFGNLVEYQMASWGTFVETFGEEQIKRANRLPTFVLLWAFYAFYTSFFEGRGIFQASGLCSGLAALCLERFLQKDPPPNYELQPTAEVRKKLTVQMGKILGREVLTLAYEQCVRGLANIAPTLQQMQSSLQGSLTAENARLLWFLPSGRITQRRFIEQLSNAHSVVPFDLSLSQEGSVFRWRIAIYDVNMPGREDVWVDVEQEGDRWSWRHNRDSRFSSEEGLTLAAIPLSLFLKPAAFPFSGPFGLMGFIFDLLF